MLDSQWIIVAFALIGSGLKYIDEAFDAETFSKKTAKYLASLILLVWIGLSFLDITAGTILLSIVIGVLLTGKIDNTVFGLSTASIIGFFVFIQRIVWLPLLFLSGAGIIDEKGNDYADSHRMNGFVRFFFLHRFTMKIGAFLLCFVGIFAWQYLVAFLLFDIGYDVVGIVSQSRIGEEFLEVKSLGGDLPTISLALQYNQ
jgi:hypothetical protein